MTAGQHQPVAAADTALDESIRVTTPASLFSVIPHLLGFQPVNSLVVIGTDSSSHKARVTLRYDLPDPPDAHAALLVLGLAGCIVVHHSRQRQLNARNARLNQAWRVMQAVNRITAAHWRAQQLMRTEAERWHGRNGRWPS